MTTELPHAVVTGGAGFIGSHLVDRLLEDDYRVTVLDNFATGVPENLEAARTNGSVELIEHDVRNPFPDFDRIDAVYHFASRASVTELRKSPISIAMTNSLGTKRVLDAAVDHDATAVLASTSEVYGDPEVNPQPESYNGNVDIRGERSPYDESKRFMEAIAEAYIREESADVRIVRIFNTYGPRMRPYDGRVIPTFVRQALDGDPLTIYGEGSQTRSFCYVTDQVEGIRRLAEAPASEVAGVSVNVGTPEEITISTLADRVSEAVGTDVETVYEELPENDPKVRCPDIAKAEELLDWSPSVGLDEGLESTVDYFRRIEW